MQRKGAWGYIMAPVTMVTIATFLRDAGHHVLVMDCPAEGAGFQEMLGKVKNFRPSVVFINTSTPSIEDDLHASSFLKQKYDSSIATALFGIHASCRYEELLCSPHQVDYCIVGEPELTVRDLVHALATGGDVASVQGIALLEKSGKPTVTAERRPLDDLDMLPVPDWSLVDVNNYRLPFSGDTFLLINTNRGCPYHCIFCNAHVYYGRTPRHRSVGHIMQEIKNNVERFHVSNFMIWAEEFILDKQFVRELCETIISSDLKIKWVCNSRVDAVDETVLALIKEAGCWNIAYGIESGDQRVLNRINKRTTPEMVHHAVMSAKRAGLQVTGHVIIGFPDDTRETIARTESFINALDLDFVQYYCAMPYPGTDLYTDAVRNGWLTTTDWKHWEHNYSVLDYEHLKASEIMAFRRQLFRRFYFNRKRITRILKDQVKRPSHVFHFLSSARGFLQWIR
jgi:radical SAM superfamily enzyme YgiQ (UPF0313 family)